MLKVFVEAKYSGSLPEFQKFAEDLYHSIWNETPTPTPTPIALKRGYLTTEYTGDKPEVVVVVGKWLPMELPKETVVVSYILGGQIRSRRTCDLSARPEENVEILARHIERLAKLKMKKSDHS